MCNICHGAYGHRAGCPNARPASVGNCSLCNEPVYEGSAAVLFDEDLYHEDCFDDNAYMILRMHGAERIVAKKEDEDDY